MTVMGFAVTSPRLIGRGDEVARLERILDASSEAGPAVVLIAGEAGVGKTRLIGELVDGAVRRGRRVCVGRCVDLGEVIWPLAPLREIVTSWVDELDGETLDLVVGGARGVLAELVPELGGVGGDHPPVGPDRLCELVVGMFKRLALRKPLVVIVEDLHWADATTRTVFSALARVRRLGPLLLAGTFRSDELHRRHPVLPVLAEVERDGRCERIDVRPFGRTATAELVTILDPGGAADSDYVSDVHRRSSGNPFFIEELVTTHAAGQKGLSDTLREVIWARAVPLDDVSRDVLGVAAAAGATTADVLADVCAVEVDALRTTLEILFASCLLVPEGDEVRFRHELAREVFYDQLIPGQRARIHAELARSVTRRRPERLGEIAHHWSAAHDTRALPALVAAGRQALRVGAAAEAEGHLGRALELWDTVSEPATLAGLDHPALLTETAAAAFHARHLGEAIELNMQAAAELIDLDPGRQIEVWLQLGHLYRYSSRWAEAGEATSRALALIPVSPPSPARAAALADVSLDHIVQRRLHQARTTASEAVEVAEAVGELEGIVYAYNALVAAIDILGDVEAALEVAIVNLARCGSGVSADLTITAVHGVAGQLTGLNRYAEVPAYARRGVELARATGLGGPRGVWLAMTWIEALVLLGRWAEAEHLVGDVAELVDHPAFDAELAGCWGVALIRQGRLDEARPLIERARAFLQAVRGDWSESVPWLAAAVVILDAAQGRHHDVERLVDDVLARDPPGFDWNNYLVACAVAAQADRAAGRTAGLPASDRDHVLATAGRWVEWMEAADRDGSPPGQRQELYRNQALAHFDRLSGRNEPEQWAQLAAGWNEIGFRYDEATAHYHHAAAVLTGPAGRGASARRAAASALIAAHDIAQELRAAPLLASIDAFARRARVSLPPSVVAEPGPSGDEPIVSLGLTAREGQVLTLLAAGRSNGQIAKELFISTKTASVHVSNILRKLGVTNRVEAGAIVTQHHHPT
jgi:DNA-binding CsgD family transcriptional regulator/tetratricopeptide (TPR) repeat protein